MNTEMTTLKANMNDLWHCLHALLKRVEQLEDSATSDVQHFNHFNSNTPKTINGVVDELISVNDINERINEGPDVKVICHETMKDDPEAGVTRRTVIAERVVTTKAFQVIPISDNLNRQQSIVTVNETGEKSKMSTPRELICENGEISFALSSEMSSRTITRVVQLGSNPFRKIDYDRIGNLVIVTRVKPDSTVKDIRAGDAIVEINGIPVTEMKRLTDLEGNIIVKVIPTPLHKGPSVYYRAALDYNGSEDSRVPMNFNVLNLKKGDIVQAFSKDSNWIQGRKVNDLKQAGLCPVNVLGDRISMLTPFGRRVLVLLGVPGVGRRTLKAMLLTRFPQYFASVTPYTSRVPRPDELEGREYYFRTKKEMLERINAGDMVEWGELNGQLYGTSKETIRSCIRSGRVCLLDCEPKALRYLYNAEFMPLVVLISPPEMDHFRQINKLREEPYTEEQMKAYVEENKALMESSFAKMFHIVLVNKNLDATFNRLMEILSELRDQAQWIPEAWLRRE